MTKKFNVEFLEEVFDFLDGLDAKTREKILFNIDKAQVKTDNTLFKKLTSDIWEFRTLYGGKQYRLFSFWDKRTRKLRLWLRHMVLSKKHRKHPKKKLIRQSKS